MEPMRAGAWIRVSTGGQDEANQVPDVERYCTEHYYNVVERYVLHDKSASKGEQQAELDRALADMKSGHIKVLVCWHSWRLERRGPRYIFNFIGEANEAGGRVESVQEPEFGKLGEFGSDAMTALTAIMGQQFSKTLRAATKLAHDRIDANGASRYRVPFGYALDGPKYNRRLAPTEAGRAWVPKIYQAIIDGDSLADVCWWLDSLKIRFRKDGTPAPWWPATVMQLIRNPVYIGHLAADDGRWLHDCEALVDATTFRLANEALSDRNRRQRGPRGRPENRAMLKGAIRCPACDVPMHKNASVNTRGGHVYYRCRGAGPAQKGCGLNVDYDLVNATVDKIMAVTWRVPVMLRTLVKGTDSQAGLDQLAMELRQLPARGLSRADEQAERDRLWAEEDRLKALPVEPDRWEETPTGELYSEEYERQPLSGRGAWLARHGFVVYPDKAAVKMVRRSADGREVTWTEPLPTRAR